jgi:N-acetylglucosamine malate deacetylase 1
MGRALEDIPSARFRARSALSRFMAVLLRARSRAYIAAPAAPILVFAPHPDDEALGCAGLILEQCRTGRSVSIAYLTDGSGSHPGHPRVSPAEIAQIRRAEALAATGLLGVPPAHVHFLGARDGTLDRLDAPAAGALAAALATVLAATRPAEIFLPCRKDGSTEHEAGFVIVSAALRRAGLRPRVFEYPIWAWWNPRRLARPWLTSRRIWRLEFRADEPLKRRALAQYASQFEPLPPWDEPAVPREFSGFFSSAEEFFFESSFS